MVITVADLTPDIDAARFIAPSADIAGNVHLAHDASVFYQCVLRADRSPIHIGAGTNLQDGVIVHTDPEFPTTVGAGVSVGHRAVLHGCTVEDDCLIGMGAIVLNGAVVGAGSLVAAGTVVTEGAVIPPRSLVAGVPGRVRRQIDDGGVERIRRNAAVYLELAASHAAAHRQ